MIVYFGMNNAVSSSTYLVMMITMEFLLLLIAFPLGVVAFLPAPLGNNADALQHVTTSSSPHSSTLPSFRLFEKPGWLEDAMEGIPPQGGDDDSDRLSDILPLDSGLAGFAVDAKLGFCAILAATDKDQASFLPVVVSSIDTDRVSSPEALTMVQLAGGLDLGTMILPPDLLARLVADELVEDDEESEAEEMIDEEKKLRDLRRVVTLTQVDVLANPDYVAPASESSSSSSEVSPSSPERLAAIDESLPKVWMAVKGLPGLATVPESQVKAALLIHADSETGAVDRDAFTNILDTIRKEVSPREQSQVVFRLTANVLSGDSIKKVTVDTTNAVHALGLSMRNKVTVNLVLNADNDNADDNDEVVSSSSPLVQLLQSSDTILERFPAFRPMSELLEDAKIMDGFIPSMYQKAQLDNDMKE